MSSEDQNGDDDVDAGIIMDGEQHEHGNKDRLLLDDLVKSCRSITAASLSFPKFAILDDSSTTTSTAAANRVHKADTTGVITCKYEAEVLIRQELEITRWLEGQIDEYRAILSRRKFQEQQYKEQPQHYSWNQEEYSTHKTFPAAATETVDVAIGDETNNNKFIQRDLTSFITPNTDAEESQYPVKRIKQQQQKRSEQQLKDELFDLTLQRDREHTLLTRILMSKASMYTSFPHYAAAATSTTMGCHLYKPPLSSPSELGHQKKAHNNKEDDNPIGWDFKNTNTNSDLPNDDAHILSKEEDPEYYLRKQALSARDFMVLTTLDTTKLIDKSRKSLRDLVQRTSAAQQENRDLWKELSHQLQQRKEEEGEEQDLLTSSRAHIADGDEQQTASIRKEIVLLENILTHSICGSGMDWYNNARLRQILERLQTDGAT